MATGGALNVPALVLSGVALESDAPTNLTGTAALVLPVPVVVSTGNAGGSGIGALTTPEFILSASGLTPVPGVGEMTLPPIHVSGLGEAPVAGTGALTLPLLQVSGGGGFGAALVLPVPIVAGAGTAGATGVGTLTLPLQVVSGVGSEPYVGTAGIVLPTPKIIATGVVGSTLLGSLALPRLLLAGQGFTGTIGRAAIALPVFKLSGLGNEPSIGTAAITFPVLHVYGVGRTPTQTTDANGDIKAIVMNTQTGALSEFTNYHFNSMAKFNGVYLGASDQGLFLLQGENDNGAIIQAAARLGISDFGTSFRKRIERCYVGYRTNGSMVLRIQTDEKQQRDYMMERSEGGFSLHGNHVKIGRGVEARYWQFEIRNVQGSDFELNIMELKPTRLGRRIGGRDA
jgi:hypothetical protein